MAGLSRRTFIRNAATGAGAAALSGPVVAGMGAGPAAAAEPESGPLRVERMTVEYAEEPLGIDVSRPRLSWVLSAEGHGARQRAYQVLVSDDPDELREGRARVWDSGRVESSQSLGVEYDGPGLAPRTRYYWRVRVWDHKGRASRWSDVSWWETALGAGWTADWIGAEPQDREELGFEGTSWIWTPGATPSDAPVGTRWFRAVLDLPAGEGVRRATLVMTADDDFVLFLDGTEALSAPQMTDGWRTGRTADVTSAVQESGTRLVVAVAATNRPGPVINPAGLLGRLRVELDGGEVVELVTGAGWKCSETEEPGWSEADFDDTGWQDVAVLGEYGIAPWGTNVSVAVPDRPAPLLRREFELSAPVERARLYASGLAYHELHLNGERVGSAVLDPGFTAYDQTVLYVTHDVTDLLSEGLNAVGVELGRGFFGMTTANVWNWHEPPWHGEPRLLLQLEVDHPDGSTTTITSDGSWRVTEGPTRSDSLFAGETYDARHAQPGWTEPGFDDGPWTAAAVLEAPSGRLVAQNHEPIAVTETVRPVGITELPGGAHVVDMGQTLAGWARLSVEAAAGTRVSLLYGEKLHPDGSVNAVNGLVSGNRFQRDEYVCSGQGVETWEPRFSYKGFRYVQVEGLPEAPSLDTVTGRLVHSDVPTVGTFRCSEPRYEQMDRAMRRTLLNNLHGIPTDTPKFEKNGWTGDAHVGLPTMAFAFDLTRFLTKWAGDLADSQVESGQVPVIVPTSGWGYQELAPSPEWTTVYPYLIREMYRWYGDERIVGDHWAHVTRYVDWEIDRRQDGLAVTALGDYVSPSYQGNPPEDTRLTATAYLYRALLATAEMADLLGRPGDAEHYRAVADESRDALNATFLDRAVGHYRTDRDPEYRQTSNAIPLAFGIVPSDEEERVVASLVDDIRNRGNHLNTGNLGTSVLLPVLTSYGHTDVAYALAMQTTYPSWGYWFENGADTMWEMWELNSRSRNHYFHGTVSQWFYENVAGLRPGDGGYERFVVRPDARQGLDSAEAGLDTVRGRASAGWSRQGSTLHLDVTVPVGSRAEVHVPTRDAGDVAVAPSPGATRRAVEPGFAVFEVGHGRWRFVSQVSE